MRQWDTKKQFKPRYGYVAKLVFLGIWIALWRAQWGHGFQQLWIALWPLIKNLGNVLFGIALLVLSPVAFPLLCAVERHMSKQRRLEYLRQNRARDEDI